MEVLLLDDPTLSLASRFSFCYDCYFHVLLCLVALLVFFAVVTFESRPRNDIECPLSILEADGAAIRLQLSWITATILPMVVLIQGLVSV